ncbi:acyl-CoA thioesterase [Pirellula sp. SH-Sr6A]|uniref:acyl-CoA thioesterase n=1 Tax=Pirellula sp. SH-Sr6A TaxID=1632865 RepID=UPI000A950407|nr:thioesterase family protein [Pirellula sp. SH-Sr6A]
MTSEPPSSPPEHITPLRVRYCEIDGQGRVHNSQYLNYFERGRVEMLRSFGISYKEIEKSGLMLVVKSMQVEFHSPAEFDEELELVTSLNHSYGARIDHGYRIVRPPESDLSRSIGPIVVTGTSSIACVDRTGKVRRLPKELQLFRSLSGD